MNGTNIHWLIFGLIDALRDEDPRVSKPDVGAEMYYDMLGGRLTMDFGSPYTIEIWTNDWRITAGISGPYEAQVFDSVGDMRLCKRELTVLRMMLPTRNSVVPSSGSV